MCVCAQFFLKFWFWKKRFDPSSKVSSWEFLSFLNFDFFLKFSHNWQIKTKNFDFWIFCFRDSFHQSKERKKWFEIHFEQLILFVFEHRIFFIRTRIQLTIMVIWSSIWPNISGRFDVFLGNFFRISFFYIIFSHDF